MEQTLYELYNQILGQLENLPRSATYRVKTEQVVQQRIQIVKSEENVEVLEEKIGCGQVEELIDQVATHTRWAVSVVMSSVS